MPSEIFKRQTSQERLDEIQKEFEISCSTKSKEELEEMLRKIQLMTTAQPDLAKKIKTIVDNLRERFGVKS
jgi:hypothetical protein